MGELGFQDIWRIEDVDLFSVIGLCFDGELNDLAVCLNRSPVP